MGKIEGVGRRALSGVKVVEYAQLVSGPYCGKLMADLGAEVIKVEEPGVGDEARRREPFSEDIPGPERSGLFLYLNTNKLGVTLNLKSATGQKIFRRLVEDADILVENNPPDFLKELSLDYGSLRAINPRLIVTSITPFGQSGPYRDYKAYNLNTYHIGGLGYPGGSSEPGTSPLKAGGSQGDFIAALHGAVGAMVALCHQRATGQGQHVDVSAMESVAGILDRFLQYYTRYGRVNHRSGNQRTSLIPCKDGMVHYFIVEDAQWDRFVEVMGSPEWGKSELFKGWSNRARNWDALEPLITAWTTERTKDQIIRLCQANRVPFAPVNSMSDLADSGHLAARHFFVEIDHWESGRIRYPSAPYKLEKTPWQVSRPAPLLGQHNEEVYCDRLGYSPSDLVKLAQSGVI